MCILYYFCYISDASKKKDKTSNSYTNTFSSYTFIFVLVFVIVYIILTIYIASPVYCMGLEQEPNTISDSSTTYLGINANVVASMIAGTSAVVATMSVPPAMKMKILAGGWAGGLASVYAIDQISQPQNWASVKVTLEKYGIKREAVNFTNMDHVQKSSVVPLDFDFYQTMNSLFYYFPSLKTILLERLPDQCFDNFLMTYQTLFTQYNIMVLICLFSLFIIVSQYTMIFLLIFISKQKVYLLEKYPTFLGKVANSRNIDLFINLLTLSLYLHFLVLGKCLYFMFVNYIPSNIGNITDIALQNSNI